MTAQEKRKEILEQIRAAKSPEDIPDPVVICDTYSKLFLEQITPFSAAEIPFIIFGLSEILDAVKQNAPKKDIYFAEILLENIKQETVTLKVPVKHE